jgi:hypothetical protein
MTRTCPDHRCLTRIRASIESAIATTDLRAQDQPRAVTMTCWAMACLAVDDTALAPLLDAPALEGFFAEVAAHFPRRIAELRGHLAPEERGVGCDVPAWVLATFVQWPVGEGGGNA